MATNPRAVGDITLAIAAEMRAQRGARQLSQAQIFEATGIPVNTLSKMERGQMALDAEQIESIAKVYGMLGEELISLARKHAAIRDEENQVVYQSDGALDPSNTRGFRSSDSHISELLAQAKEEAGDE